MENKENLMYKIMTTSLIMTSMLMTTFKNWMILYITMELLTMTTLLLMSLNSKNAQSKEGSMKYLMLSAISSTMLITGMLLTSYQHNSQNMMLKTLLSSNNNMMLTMILFKLGSAPFHIWVTDMYEATKTMNLPLIILIPKMAIISTLMTFETSNNILLMSGILSTTMGAMGAMNQKKMKRLLAYSSINNMGIMIMGLHMYTLPSMQAIMMHMMIYTTTLTIMLMTLHHTYYKKQLTSETFQNDKSNHTHKIIISTLLLSLSGLPPFPGFLSKWLIMSSTMKQQLMLTSTWMLMTNIPSTAYYLYTMMYSYFKTIMSTTKTMTENNMNNNNKYKMAILTFPILSTLIHPQLMLMPTWTVSTKMMNVPSNNKSPNNKIYINTHTQSKN
uniref:NADH-ubiquinone oxidoreductase chain 2 n=1 Tax=Oopsacas minuta TaxID=111878 RepID=A0A0G3ZAT3_9METZ|nr:NADH dehydrogenase subunit 2 [Oopsacas minuta]AKM54876.1 NADH dehydrogenase subunit 2 [Oopsacas minuta]